MNIRDIVTRHPRLVTTLGLILLLISLSLAAIHPLTFGSLPRTDDGLQHLYRLVALDTAIRHGDLWPRYVPTLLYGYGEPLFNYYSPVSLYLPEILHLVGLRFQDALLLGLILYVLIGTGGAYKFGEGWGGPLMGIGTAVAYTYAPYILQNLLERGAVGEVAGLALLPWVLWAFHRLALTHQRRDFVIPVALLALLLLMHNITAIQSIALLAVYCAFLWWTGDHPPRIFVHLGLAGLLAIGLTVFFWLPALAEKSYVQLDRTQIGVNAPPGTPDFYGQFQSLGQTFALPAPADLTAFNPTVVHTLGWPQIALALLGIGLLLPARAADRQEALLKRWLIVALALTALLVFMTTSLSAGMWATAPLLHFFQFPWRMLGPASLLLALMSGAGIMIVTRTLALTASRIIWLALCLIVLIVYAMPGLYCLYIPDPAAASIVDAQNYERQTGQLGGTARGEYIPRWVTKLPRANRLAGLYARSDVIPRLQPLPIVTVADQVWGPTSARLTLTTTEDTILVFDWLFFPGWWAHLDGQEAAIHPSQPGGLVTLAIPRGEHHIEIGFGPTPLRLIATIASGVFLLLTGVVLLAFPHRLWPPLPESQRTLLIPQAMALAVTAGALSLALFALKVVVIDNIQSPIKQARFAGGVERGLQHPVWAVFGHQVTLLGYDLADRPVESGQSGQIALYWQPTDGVIAEDYSSTLYVRDSAGNIVLQSGSFYPGGWATSTWVPGFWVREVLPLDVPPATPPGAYSIEVGLYWPKGKRSLDVLDGQSRPRGVLIEIGQLQVSRPASPARLDNLRPEDRQGLTRLDIHLTDSITLVAASPLPASGEVGQRLPLILYWHTEKPPGKPLDFRLVWADPGGDVLAASPPELPTVGYPLDQWQPGDFWRGLHILYIPGKLSAGTYTAGIQLYDQQGKPVGRPAALGQIAVSAPPRSFTPPRPTVSTSTSWENGIRLVGYDLYNTLVKRGDAIRLNLYWQSTRQLDASLTAFVHIFDANGNIVAQIDSIPGGGSRPTTGWAPGEYLTDDYRIVIKPDTPSGQYFIRIGWYNATTDDRIPVVDGAPPDFWLLPQTIRVIP